MLSGFGCLVPPTYSPNHAAPAPTITETKADMVHPGYGFLAENADFAKAVQKKDVIWIGPSPETIKSMGDKIESRKLISKTGLIGLLLESNKSKFCV